MSITRLFTLVRDALSAAIRLARAESINMGPGQWLDGLIT
jgi:hypothetical protein